MGFLRRLLSSFGSTSRVTPDVPVRVAVAEDEILSRFVIDRKHIDKSKKVVKPEAFLPRGDPPMTSVFRIRGLVETEVWGIGVAVAVRRGRELKARADFEALILKGTPLGIDADDSPPRHANIVRWPAEKSAQLQLAIEIAAEAELRVAPTISVP